jgi:hypothetical protein
MIGARHRCKRARCVSCHLSCAYRPCAFVGCNCVLAQRSPGRWRAALLCTASTDMPRRVHECACSSNSNGPRKNGRAYKLMLPVGVPLRGRHERARREAPQPMAARGERAAAACPRWCARWVALPLHQAYRRWRYADISSGKYRCCSLNGLFMRAVASRLRWRRQTRIALSSKLARGREQCIFATRAALRARGARR